MSSEIRVRLIVDECGVVRHMFPEVIWSVMNVDESVLVDEQGLVVVQFKRLAKPSPAIQPVVDGTGEERRTISSWREIGHTRRRRAGGRHQHERQRQIVDNATRKTGFSVSTYPQ